MKRIYLAGPMRVHPHDLNFPTFDSARDYLRREGWTVASPADLDRRFGLVEEHADGSVSLTGRFSAARAMRMDLVALLCCEAIALLPGWEASDGVAQQLAVAQATGMAVWYLRRLEHGGARPWSLVGRDPYEVRVIPPAIVGLSGYAGVGKDTCAQFLVDRHLFERRAIADRVRAVVLDSGVRLAGERHQGETVERVVHALGWEQAKRVPEVRTLLQRLGTAVRDHLGEDAWLAPTLADMRPGGRYVITDVRFTNEADAIRARGGVVLRVERPGFGPVNRHISETEMAAYDVDGVIANDGTLADLRDRTERVALVTTGIRPLA